MKLVVYGYVPEDTLSFSDVKR